MNSRGSILDYKEFPCRLLDTGKEMPDQHKLDTSKMSVEQSVSYMH